MEEDLSFIYDMNAHERSGKTPLTAGISYIDNQQRSLNRGTFNDYRKDILRITK